MTTIADTTDVPGEASFGGFAYQLDAFAGPLTRHDRIFARPQRRAVLLEVDGCGLCHSDLHVQDGFFRMGKGVKVHMADRGICPPIVMGHEIAGTVIAVGPDCTDAKVGDRRVVYPWIGCGECSACLAGNDPLCASPRTVGIRLDGGFASHVSVPDERYLLSYGTLTPSVAATAACSILTAYGALRKLPALTQDDHLLLVGIGGVGLAAVGLARHLTPARIIAVDTQADRLAIASDLGADITIRTGTDDAVARVKDATGGVAAAIDFVGAPATLQLAIDGARRGGTVVVVGLHGDEITVPITIFPQRLITLTGSYVGTLAQLREVLDLLEETGLDLIVHDRPVEEINAAFAELRDGHVVGRTVLSPRSETQQY